MKVKISELKEVTYQALLKNGYTADEAPIILEVLLYAQLRGNNQGVIKLTGAGMPRHPNAKPIEIARETKLSALLNGNQTQGMVVMTHAMNMALGKAREYGFGIVGTFNTSSSTGAIGYYANKIAAQDFIGFVFAGSPPYVTTYGSYERLFGTNPLAIGLPTTADPLVLDLTTSAMAYFGLVEAKLAGRPIPPDVAFDKNGQPTSDPAVALEGALRPFDRGHKSAGLSLIVEALTGPLVMASFVGIGDISNWGNLIYVIDPALLVDKAAFKTQMTQLIERVRGAKRLPSVERIFVPGERGNAMLQAALAAGEVDIEDNLWNALKAAIA